MSTDSSDPDRDLAEAATDVMLREIDDPDVLEDAGVSKIHEWARDWHEARLRGDDESKRETDASAGWRAEYHYQHVTPDLTDR